jgi:RNA polymerase sigma factor (sigma-70 family)
MTPEDVSGPHVGTPRNGLEVPARHDLAALLEGSRPKLKRVLSQFRIPPEDAEDVLQELFVRFLYKSPTIELPEGWLVGTLRNLCLGYWHTRRLRERRQTHLDPLALDEGLATVAPAQWGWEVRADLAAAVAQLGPKQRAFFLHWLLHAPGPDLLAQRFGYRPSSLRQTLKRCRQAIRAHLTMTDGP